MKKWLLIMAFAVTAALVAALVVWQPWSPAPSSATAVEQAKAIGAGWSATATFPGEPGLRARVEGVEQSDKQTDALPAATSLIAVADYSVEGGPFPASGAQVSFTLDESLAAGRVPVIAHWNEAGELWEPVATTLSEDRRTASATVSHFSEYGFFDYLFNALGQVTGNAATSGVVCDQPIPDWADPQFFDDINSPVLWCGGRDSKNTEILVAKVKMNRDTAAKVTLAIDPAWAYSDLWQASPTDLATMADAANLPATLFGQREYLIQPLGEMNFGFDRSALEALYYGGSTRPLIQVQSGWFYTAATVMWDLTGSVVTGDNPITAVSSAMSMMECGQALLTATSSDGAVDAFGKALACLSTQQSKDSLHRGVRTVLSDRYPQLTNGWITIYSKKILSKFGLIGLGLTTASLTLKVLSAGGDASLPDNVRQFMFEPSLKSIKARGQQQNTYAGTQMGTNYTFKYPKGWRVVVDSSSAGHVDMSVVDANGTNMAELRMLEIWDLTTGVKPRPVAKISDLPSDGTMSAMKGAGSSGAVKFVVRTVTMDLTSHPDEAALYWDGKKVAVAVSAGGWKTPDTELLPVFLTGVAGIKATQTFSNQGATAVLFSTVRYFDSLQQAEAWTASDEHRKVVGMISSFTG